MRLASKVLMVASCLLTTGWSFAMPPRQPYGRRRRPLSFEPSRPRDVVLLTGRVEAPVAVNPDGLVISLTDDGVLEETSAAGYCRWAVQLGPSAGAPALDDEGTTYVAGRDEMMYAVDRRGDIRWSRSLGGQPWAGVVPSRDWVAVALANGKVRLYSREKGFLRAQLLTGLVPSAPLVRSFADRLLFPSTTGELVELDPTDGIVWRTRLANAPVGPLALNGSGVAFAVAGDGSITRVDADGSIAWQVAMSASADRSPVLGAEGTLFAAAGADLVALDAATGKSRWRASVGGRIVGGPLVSDDGTIYVSAIPSPGRRERLSWGEVVAVAQNGQVTKRISLPATPVAGLTLDAHRLWVGLRDGTLRRFEVPQKGLAGSAWAKARGGLANSGASPAVANADR